MSRSHAEIEELVEACRAWCALTGARPKRTHNNAFIYQALKDYPGTFAELNEHQIMFVAGAEIS